MQEREFDNLMNGNAAKYANLDGLNPNGNIGLMGALMRAKAKDHTSEDIETAREAIKENEVEIPAETRRAMDLIISFRAG